MNLFTGIFKRIESVEIAERTIRETAYGLWFFAALQLVSVYFLSFLNVFPEVTVFFFFSVFGVFSFFCKSRILSGLLLLYSVAIVGLTILNKISGYEEGRNILLSLVLVAIGIESLKSTIVYHSLRKTNILWKNLFLRQMIAIISSLAALFTFAIVLAVLKPTAESEYSEDEIMLCLGIFLVLYTFMVLPVTPFAKRKPMYEPRIKNEEDSGRNRESAHS